MESENKPQRRRSYNEPIIHKEFPDLGNEHRVLKVRLLQYQNIHFDKPTEPRLDIRRYLNDHQNRDGTKYTGFTREGISLSRDDLFELKKILDQALELMETI